MFVVAGDENNRQRAAWPADGDVQRDLPAADGGSRAPHTAETYRDTGMHCLPKQFT